MEQGSSVIEITGAASQNPPEAGAQTLGGSLESLGQELRDAVQGAGTAVADTVATFKAAMGKTAHTVEGAWQGSVGSLGHVLNLSDHVRKHPWPMLGGAALLGYVVGTLVRRLRQ